MADLNLETQWNNLYQEWHQKHKAMLDAFPAVNGWITHAHLDEWNRRRTAVAEVRARMDAFLAEI